MPRELAGDIALANTPWVGTGKPVSADFHIHDIASLLYEDLCGAVGSNTRRCNLAGNVIASGNHDDSEHMTIELRQAWESATINLAVRTAAPGTKNTQGIDQETASRQGLLMDYDIYTGFMSLDESIFWQIGGRFHAPVCVQPQSGNRCWSHSQLYPGLIFNPDPYCLRGSNGNAADDISALGIPPGQVDSLRVELFTLSQGFRFGGTNLGNTRGTYFDNLRAGFVRGGAAPALSQEIWNKYQDQFPFNEGVTPGDNSSFDTTTALVHTGLNIVAPANAFGVVAGDTITANSPYVGDGVTTGVRMDLVFRIDPGPGNYAIKGNRTSALVNRDPAHPFFAAYMASNGPYGSPGGHGGTWNRNVWNSARMDSADVNLYPIVSRGIGGPVTPCGWARSTSSIRTSPRSASPTTCASWSTPPARRSRQTWSATAPCRRLTVRSRARRRRTPRSCPTAGSRPARTSSTSCAGRCSSRPAASSSCSTRRGCPAGPRRRRRPRPGALVELRRPARHVEVDALRRRRPRLPAASSTTPTAAARIPRSAARSTRSLRQSDGATQGWHALDPNADPNDPAGFVAANLGSTASTTTSTTSARRSRRGRPPGRAARRPTRARSRSSATPPARPRAARDALHDDRVVFR
jgi:hypothetical protein